MIQEKEQKAESGRVKNTLAQACWKVTIHSSTPPGNHRDQKDSLVSICLRPHDICVVVIAIKIKQFLLEMSGLFILIIKPLFPILFSKITCFFIVPTHHQSVV